MQRTILGLAVPVLAGVLALTTPAFASFDDLLIYARIGDTARAIALLDAGEDPNPPEFHDGYSPLQFAAGSGNVELTLALLAAGADTEYRDHNGDRALLWAAEWGHTGTVRFLLAAGSPPDADDPYGETPAMSALEGGHVDVLQPLIDAGADMSRYDQTGMTALHYAARLDDPAAVRMVLAAGGNPNVFEEIALETPLHEAAFWSNGTNIPLLLAAGASLSARTAKGQTPLYAAAVAGNRATLDALLAAGADPDARDLDGHTPIFAAMELNSVSDGQQRQVVDALAALTTDIDRAFSAALWNGLPRTALTLFRRGADPNIVDEYGRAPLTASADYPGLHVFDALVGAGADIERFGGETLLAAAMTGNTQIIAELLARGVAVETRDGRGATPLLKAAQAGKVEAVRMLLEQGADAHAVDQLGHGAAEYMKILPALYVAEIDVRRASRAFRPTGELEGYLDDLRARHDQIRELLALD